MGFRSTREVARLLGIGTSRLSRAVWDKRVADTVDELTHGLALATSWTGPL